MLAMFLALSSLECQRKTKIPVRSKEKNYYSYELRLESMTLVEALVGSLAAKLDSPPVSAEAVWLAELLAEAPKCMNKGELTITTATRTVAKTQEQDITRGLSHLREDFGAVSY